MNVTRAYLFAAAVIVGGNALPTYAQLREAATTTTAVSGTEFEVTTGFVAVPEDRLDTSTKNIELAVVRIRRTGVESNAHANVMLAGGPGDSGVNLAMGLLKQGGPAVWALFDGDIIGIDQRGTGRSRPNLDTPARYDLPVDTPASVEAWLPLISTVNQRVANDFRSRGIRLEAYNTRESADDVAEVMRTLGYGASTFWGRSYGTHLGLAVLKRHPASVKRLVLISPEGPDHTWKSPSQVDRVLGELVSRGATDLIVNLQTVLRKLGEQPVSVRVRDPLMGADTTIALGAFDVQWIVSQALGDPRLVATLPAALRLMAAGQFEQFGVVALLRRSRSGVQSAMKQMMDLSSGASVTRTRTIERESRTALLGNAINFPTMWLRDAWKPVIDLGDAFRGPVTSATPVLMIVGDLDPRTPVANARDIAQSLSAAQVVVVRNATHEFDVFGSPAIRELLSAFLHGERVVDTVELPAISFQ